MLSVEYLRDGFDLLPNINYYRTTVCFCVSVAWWLDYSDFIISEYFEALGKATIYPWVKIAFSSSPWTFREGEAFRGEKLAASHSLSPEDTRCAPVRGLLKIEGSVFAKQPKATYWLTPSFAPSGKVVWYDMEKPYVPFRFCLSERSLAEKASNASIESWGPLHPYRSQGSKWHFAHWVWVMF